MSCIIIIHQCNREKGLIRKELMFIHSHGFHDGSMRQIFSRSAAALIKEREREEGDFRKEGREGNEEGREGCNKHTQGGNFPQCDVERPHIRGRGELSVHNRLNGHPLPWIPESRPLLVLT